MAVLQGFTNINSFNFYNHLRIWYDNSYTHFKDEEIESTESYGRTLANLPKCSLVQEVVASVNEQLGS